MSPRADVLVIGGGLAGSMAAIELARSGRSVIVLEKTTEAHNKVCGDFLSREALMYLGRLGIAPGALGGVPIRTVRLVTATFVRESPLPFTAWSLTRRALDEHMLGLVATQPVQLERGAWAASLDCKAGVWSAQLRDGRAFRAESAILASGKLDLHGWRRPPGLQNDLVAFKMYFRLSDAQQQRLGNAVELVLHPGGYTGLQPVENGIANLCVLIRNQRLRSIGSTWTDVLADLLQHTPHLRERLQDAEPMLQKPLAASQLPYGHLQRTAQPGLWRVGDQAAVIPSFCGDGTAIALHSGALAASCLAQGLPSGAYQQELRKHLASRIRLATGLSQLLVSVPQVAQLARAFPALLKHIATSTRIPDSALLPAHQSNPQRFCGGTP